MDGLKAQSAEETKIPLRELVATLEQENRSLKLQLDEALALPQELDRLHTQNRELTSKLIEANQKIDNFQNRMKISQQKIQNSENRYSAYEEQIRQLNDETMKLHEEINNYQREIQNLKKTNEITMQKDDSDEKNDFFRTLSSQLGTNVSSYNQITDTVNILINERKKLNEKIDCSTKQQTLVTKLEKKNSLLKEGYTEIYKENERLNKIIEELQSQLQLYEKQINDQKSKYENFNMDLQNKVTEITKNAKNANQEFETKRQNYEQELNLREQEILKFKKVIEEKEDRIQELRRMLSDPSIKEDEEKSLLISQISQRNQDVESLNNEIEILHGNINELNNKLKSSVLQIQKSKSQYDQLKQKSHAQKQRISELESLNYNTRLEIDNKIAQIHSLQMKIDSLGMQLQASKTSNTQSETAYAVQAGEIDKLKKSVAILENISDDLRREIETLNNTKTTLAIAVQKQAAALIKYESALGSKQKEIETLQSKLKVSNKHQIERVQPIDASLVSSIQKYLIPEFHEPLRTKLIQTMASTQGPPAQKVKEVFKQIAKEFESTQEPFIQKESELREELEKAQMKSEHIYELSNLSNTILQGLAYILRTTRADNESLGNKVEPSNQDLIDFASEQSSKLEKGLKEADLMDSRFISAGFLFSGSFEDRRNAIQEIVSKGWSARHAFDLFCLQLMINSTQEKELNVMRNSLVARQAELDTIQDAVGIEDMNDIATTLTELAKKTQTYRKQNKKLISIVKELSDREEQVRDNLNIIEEYGNLEQRLKEVEEALESAEEELHQKDALLKQKDAKLDELSERIGQNNATTEGEYQKIRSELIDAERLIDDKNNTIRSLTLQIQQLQSNADVSAKANKKAMEEIQAVFNSRIEKWQQQYAMLKAKRIEEKKNLIQRQKQQQKESQEERAQLAKCQNELRERLEATIKALGDQINEKDEHAQKLAEDLKQSEEKYKSTAAHLSEMEIANKSLELKLQSVSDQLKREAQLVASQNALREITAETRHQEEIGMLKSKLMAEKMGMLVTLLDAFSELGDCDDDIDEQAALDKLLLIASEYRQTKSMF